jgi:hypothetical protein
MTVGVGTSSERNVNNSRKDNIMAMTSYASTPVSNSQSTVFGGRDNPSHKGQEIDVIYAGVKLSKNGFDIYVFLDSEDPQRQISIYRCSSMDYLMDGDSRANPTGNPVKVGDLIRIKYSGFRETDVGVQCFYQLTGCDDEYKAEQDVLDLCEEAIRQDYPVSVNPKNRNSRCKKAEKPSIQKNTPVTMSSAPIKKSNMPSKPIITKKMTTKEDEEFVNPF